MGSEGGQMRLMSESRVAVDRAGEEKRREDHRARAPGESQRSGGGALGPEDRVQVADVMWVGL